MNREQRIQTAQETVNISNAGYYILNTKNTKIALADGLKSTRINIEQLKNEHFNSGKYTPTYNVVPKTVSETLANEISSSELVGILNFASAKNRGGGFLKGSLAQEEALCICSNLYIAQLLLTLPTPKGEGF